MRAALGGTLLVGLGQGCMLSWGSFGGSNGDQGKDPVVEIAAGDAHVCVVRRSKHVACWGNNSNSQLGVDKTNRPSSAHPELVKLEDGSPLEGVTHLALGGYHSCALT